MAGGVFGVDLIMTSIVVGYLVLRFAKVRQMPLTCLAVFITWFIVFSIIFILPMDVSQV